MQLAWATDTHFDAASELAFEKFIQELQARAPQALLLTGDISHGFLAIDCLKRLHRELQLPIYYVFGNHDFYDASIAEQHEQAKVLAESHPQITYLSDTDPVALNDDWALVGHDGWADAKDGSFFESPVRLNDFKYIRELIGLEPIMQFRTLCALGEQAAQSMRSKLKLAFETHDKVLALTHVPPFRQACLYHGEEANDDWAPFFVSQSMGSMLMELMPRFPDKEVLLLCGHCHHEADYQALANLRVIAGAADYGKPELQALIVLKEKGVSYDKN